MGLGARAGKTFAGGVGEGAKGNEGTSAAIKNTLARSRTTSGRTRRVRDSRSQGSSRPRARTRWCWSVDSVGRSIDAVKVKGEGNDLVLDTNSFYLPTERGAYPIVLATYEIVCSKYPDSEKPQALKAFLTVATSEGQKGLRTTVHPDSSAIQGTTRHRNRRDLVGRQCDQIGAAGGWFAERREPKHEPCAHRRYSYGGRQDIGACLVEAARKQVG